MDFFEKIRTGFRSFRTFSIPGFMLFLCIFSVLTMKIPLISRF